MGYECRNRTLRVFAHVRVVSFLLRCSLLGNRMHLSDTGASCARKCTRARNSRGNDEQASRHMTHREDKTLRGDIQLLIDSRFTALLTSNGVCGLSCSGTALRVSSLYCVRETSLGSLCACAQRPAAVQYSYSFSAFNPQLHQSIYLAHRLYHNWQVSCTQTSLAVAKCGLCRQLSRQACRLGACSSRAQ